MCVFVYTYYNDNYIVLVDQLANENGFTKIITLLIEFFLYYN